MTIPEQTIIDMEVIPFYSNIIFITNKCHEFHDTTKHSSKPDLRIVGRLYAANDCVIESEWQPLQREAKIILNIIDELLIIYSVIFCDQNCFQTKNQYSQTSVNSPRLYQGFDKVNLKGVK